MAQLRLFVFGPPRIERDGEVVELGLRRALALLVYLAVTRQPQSRDALATLLWPENDQREARANLRRTLHRLAQAIGDDVLAVSAEVVRIAPDAELWVDSHQFLSLTESGNTLDQAAALYSDDFLAGFTLPDSPAFDDWQFFERERLRQLLSQSLELLVQREKARGAWDTAAEYARRWVALDPLHEPAQRALLEAYAQAGQGAAAVRQYQELARVLEAELGTAPEEATTALYEAIRARRFPPASPAAGATAQGEAPSPPSPASPPLAAAPPLVGREHELEELLGFLTRPEGPRLITLSGPGGAGKTRLAHAVVEHAQARFAQGAHLVALAEVGEPDGVAPAIAARLGLLSGGDAESTLLRTLRNQELLLALDNFEHLLDAAPLISAILDAAPRARILVTSRERLGLSPEQLYPLNGLAIPDEIPGAETLDAPAARLLLQRARLSRPGLAPGPADVAAIARICRLVQGMPLPLTLAASWAELLSFGEIADEIARSLDFLSTEQQDVPERQRSVRAVFEASWGRLPPDAQRVFARLTVFRGGFSRQAAEAVAGATLHTLRRLANASFIALAAGAQRYEIHELLRQLAADPAAGTPDLAAAQDRHATFYLDQIRRLTAGLKGTGQRQTIATLSADAENLWAAWRRAVTRHDHEAIAGAAEGLWLFCEVRGQLLEGEQLMRAAADARGDGGGAAEHDVIGLLRAGQGHLAARRGRWTEGVAAMEQGVAMLRQATAARPTWLALALLQLGFLNRFQERYAEAERLGEESLALFAAADDRWGVAYSLLLMGTALERQGKPALAAQLLQTCLERARELEDAVTCSFAAWNLGRVHASFGNVAQARRFLDEGIAIADELGHTLSLASALLERGFLNLITGAVEPAEADLTVSAGHFATIGVTYEEAWARAGLGSVAHVRGDLDGAEALLQTGLAAAQAIGRQWHIARYLSNLGLVARDRGDAAAAASLQRQALGLMCEAGHEPWIARCATRLANTLLQQSSEDGEACGLLHEALTLALRHQLAPTALAACVAGARLSLAEGHVEEALEILTLAEEHPSATYPCRRQAAQIAARSAEELEAVRLAAARERGRRREWRTTVQQLLSALGDAAGSGSATPPTNLDPHLPPLIGRDWELTALLGLLNEPSRRLITLLGPGGIGKTRLAQEAGLAALDAFPDGAFFVPLSPISDPAQLAVAIGECLGLRFSGAGGPREQLLDYLRGRQMLLVLDNIEHLLEGVELIPALLRAAPKVTALVTTRERLGLDGELVYTLGGIAIPAGEADEQAMASGAMQLLLGRIRQIHPGFDPGPADVDAMIRICQLVEGMPLAIILAASWADMLALHAIAEQIGRSLDVLEADLRALPPRQRSVRAVFEASWERLPSAARQVFARMSVFRGSFSRRAAERLAGADLRTLRTLMNSSFITLHRDDRYGIHELLRQFGAERLSELGETAGLLERHSAYYLDELAAHQADLKGRHQLAAFAAIEQDIDNVRQAWEHALERHDEAALARALDSMFLFTEKRGRFREGSDLLQQLHDRLALDQEQGDGLWPRLTIRLSILRSLFPRAQQVPPEAVHHSLELARSAGAAAEEALAQIALGTHYARADNDYAKALAHYERAYALHQILGDRFYMAEELARLGICYGYLGDTQAFYEHCRQGYELALADGNIVGTVIAQSNMTEALVHLGRYAEAAESATRQVAVCSELQMRNGVLNALQTIALVRVLEGDLAEARRLAMEGYRLGAEIQNALSMGGCLSLLSLQAGVAGDYPLGKQFAEESLLHPRNLLGTLYAQWGLAMAQCGLARYDDAERSLRAALEAAHSFATQGPTVWLLPLVALLLNQRSRRADAVAVLRLAVTHPLAATGWIDRWPLLARLRADTELVMGSDAYAESWERGHALSVQVAVELLTSLPGGASGSTV